MVVVHWGLVVVMVLRMTVSSPEWGVGGVVLGQHAKDKAWSGHHLSLQPILIVKQQINNIDLAK